MVIKQRFKLHIQYDGTHFSGWQKQPEGRTVEGVIEKALSTLYQMDIDVIGQGRTDAGVHALQQVAHVDLPVKYNEKRIIHAMRGLLPEDVSIYGINKTDSEFHARFDAISRTYSYRIANRPIPIDRHKIWYYFHDVNLELLKECAESILGEHDFLQFCIANENPKLTTTCTITESRWRNKEGILIYTINGNRFLRHMVRRLVGTMMEVSAGKLSLKQFEGMLIEPLNKIPAYSAPAYGLILESVEYP